MIEFGAWSPPTPPPLAGAYARNDALARAVLWPTLDGHGPEDVAVDADGRVIAGLEDGRILRWPRGGGAPEVVARTGGRPLGIEVDRDGSLVVCDARRGLLRVRPGAPDPIQVLHQGLRFTNNAAIAANGTIYFSDSSTEYGIDHYRDDLLAHQPLGRVFALDPGAREPRLIADRLFFANGVALAPDDSYLVVVETSMYRLTRIGLSGNRTREVFHDNLAGFPDNLATSPRGTFWVPLPDLRNRVLDALLPRPRLRRVMSMLPDRLQPQPSRYGLVVEIDASGQLLRALHDPAGRIAMITGAREHGGTLYLGSLVDSAVAAVTL